MKTALAVCALALFLVSCSVAASPTSTTHPPDTPPPPTTAPIAQPNPPSTAPVTESTPPTPSPPIRLLFAGDVMLGRKVADVVQLDPEGLFADVQFVISQADIAVANLESPLTQRPQIRSGEQLIADPSSARLLEAVGFNAMGIANNHAGDAGPGSVLDTIAALEAVTVTPIGGGANAFDALAPQVIERAGVRVAYLAFDATGQGLAAGDTPGIAPWSVAGAEAAVAAAREQADVVAVGLHGGIEYSPAIDPQLQRLGELLAGWNVDVVWGHGPHVAQPIAVIDPDGDGKTTVVATSLGNFVFDQSRRPMNRGTVLEVLAGSEGVAAWRAGVTDHKDMRVHFEEWNLPAGDAALLDGAWWNLPARPEVAGGPERPNLAEFPYGTVIDSATADVTGDGIDDLVVAYRHPFRTTAISELYPEHDFVDAGGDSAHVGVFVPGSLRPLWGAGTLFEPIEAVLPCATGVAVAYSELDDRTVNGAGALQWNYFGFSAAPQLDGGATLGCSDIDQDGHTDPVVLDRD